MVNAEPHAPDDPLAIGARLLDRYRVSERLEVGGHSVIYRGEDERLSRPVCIKVFHKLRPRDGIYRTSYEHFVQEAFALSKLTHPNTLRIYDFGHLGEAEEGPPFQISEFMNGGTLIARVQEGGVLEGEEAVRVITPLCGALAEAHARGIVHRDIKPRNILFGTVGRDQIPKLADFGIAKSFGVDADGLGRRAGDTQVVAGRPLLMYSRRWAAPEQLAGQPVGVTTDVYSLALVIAFMLGGRFVFSSNDANGAFRDRTDSDAMIASTLEDASVPPAVVEALCRACSFAPELRQPDIETLHDDIVPALSPRRGEQRAAPLPAIPAAGDRPTATLVSGAGHTGAAPPPGPTPAGSRPAGATGGPAPTSSGPPRRIHISHQSMPLGDRFVRFVPAPGGTADVSGGGGRVRVTLIPLAGRRFCVHLKGLDCFVALAGGRPSRAVQVARSGGCEIVSPNRSVLGAVHIQYGRPAAGHTVFAVADQEVAVGTTECTQIAALDFGPGAEYVLVYLPGAASMTAAERPQV